MEKAHAVQLRHRYHAVVLSVDEITLALFGQDAGDKHDGYVTKAKRYLYKKSMEIIHEGISVVLDWGFWEYEDFGSGKADNCIVAENDGSVVGAVWTRIMNDYGHIDNKTPSFAISLYKKHRGRGIGTRLMNEMLALLRLQGYRKASLAVQKANYAVRMYKKVGFKIIDENDEEYIMVSEL